MPELARTVVGELAGRVGMIRTLFFEVTSFAPDAREGADYLITSGVGRLVVYIGRQMADGRLRPMHPVLALQSFVGPLFFHLLTRQVAEQAVGFDVPLEDAANELAAAWLRAMRPNADPDAGARRASPSELM
jgi:hypothetical protein